MSSPPAAERPDYSLARRALPLIGLVVAVLMLVLVFWYLIDVFMLGFAGVLLALLLRTPADWIASKTRLRPGLALGLVILAVVAMVAGASWLFGHALVDQAAKLSQRVPEILQQLHKKLSNYDWLIGSMQPQELANQSGFLGRGITVMAATFGALANLVIVFFVGVFLAVQPQLYVRGFLQLVPPHQQGRAREVLQATGHTLRWWLLGQVLMMLLIGVVTGIGLWLLDVPFALALAVLAGLLEFVPYVGPILSAIPAVLVALAESPQLAGYVVLLYVAIQGLEGNILQPLMQQRTIYMPPAIILLSQVVLGILVGTLGVMLATPVTATFMVLMRMLYIEDVLHRRESRPQPRRRAPRRTA
jgi:predicted PurR-regulated permease PerM